MESRSNVSTFIVHSGIPKAYNRWYSQYKSTRVRGLIIYTVEYLKVKKIKVIHKSNCVLQGVHKRMLRFQKLASNLFLNLHGRNVHRQQRQLSKFLMRYQQFASHAYCGTAGPVSHALITILQCVYPGSYDTHPHGNQIHLRLGVACPLLWSAVHALSDHEVRWGTWAMVVRKHCL